MAHEVWLFRPWTNQTHFTLEYVNKLRQLVDAVLADNTPYPRDSRVVFAGELGTVVCTATHAAQLVHLEWLVAPTHTLLHKQRRPRAFKLDTQGGKQHQGY